MASINTLVSDLEDLIGSGKAKLDFARIGEVVSKRMTPSAVAPTLRMSNFATPDKQLWFAINKPELAEPLPARARTNFLFGDFWEEVLLDMVPQSGHKLEGRGDERNFNGLIGHIDAIIDGTIVDVKTASSYAFQKFEEHKLRTTDPFGYLDQLSLYLEASQDDVRVSNKSEGAFLALNKENGKLVLDTYPKKDFDYALELERKRAMLAHSSPPQHCCTPIPHGSSGNLKLAARCSYNPFKHACHPGLRTFIYSSGPVHLTHVARRPDVPEHMGGRSAFAARATLSNTNEEATSEIEEAE